MSANLFDLLGIARTLADRANPAAARWPAGLASLASGLPFSSDTLTLVNCPIRAKAAELSLGPSKMLG